MLGETCLFAFLAATKTNGGGVLWWKNMYAWFLLMEAGGPPFISKNVHIQVIMEKQYFSIRRKFGALKIVFCNKILCFFIFEHHAIFLYENLQTCQ